MTQEESLHHNELFSYLISKKDNISALLSFLSIPINDNTRLHISFYLLYLFLRHFQILYLPLQKNF